MQEYHILSLSGGKDSTALAFFIKENMPAIFEQLEFVFFDTECELTETYEYLNKIEMFLGKPIERIKPYYSFDHLYSIYNILPSAMKRWCTVEMKTKTFRKYIHERIANGNKVNVYIGIRADELHRVNNSHDDAFITQLYPFVENNINKEDVTNILINQGIGMPDYYKWRSRSGCYFCFFQRKIEWVGLYENHPDLFQKAIDYEEKGSKERGKKFTWCQDISLRKLIEPENIKKIKESYQSRLKKTSNQGLMEMMADDCEDVNNCIFCHI